VMDDLSLHVLDIAENSAAAGASLIEIAIEEDEGRDLLTLRLADNGRGMSRSELQSALDPFYSTKAKKTGLGLPFLAQAAEQSGGGLSLESRPGRGTTVTARFGYGNIDRPPLTKMAETVMILVFGHPEIGFRYRHRRNGRDFRFDSLRFAARAGGITARPDLIAAIRKTLETGLKRIGAS